jgi:DNA helicase-2/ATP-dependent DNA helicase PcrA
VQKNKQYRKSGVTRLIENWEGEGLCTINTMNKTHRCGQMICDFANLLWPGMEPMRPLNVRVNEHEGVFLVASKNVEEYLRRFRPQVLRHARRKKAPDYEQEGLNFGVAKGAEFDRVLIIPTKPIKDYLRSGNQSTLKEKERLHVALTRARHSVAFVYDGPSAIVPTRWTP